MHVELQEQQPYSRPLARRIQLSDQPPVRSIVDYTTSDIFHVVCIILKIP